MNDPKNEKVTTSSPLWSLDSELPPTISTLPEGTEKGTKAGSASMAHAVIPDTVPTALSNSIATMLRSMPSPSNAGFGLSISIAGESALDTASGASSRSEPSMCAETLRTAELRAKGASLVQRAMMDNGRLASSRSSCDAVASVSDDEPVFEPIDGSSFDSCEPDRFLQIVEPEGLGEATSSSVLSAMQSLQKTESTLEQLFSDAPLPVRDYAEEAVQASRSIAQNSSVAAAVASDTAIHELSKAMAQASLAGQSAAASVSAGATAGFAKENGFEAKRDSLDIDGLYVAMMGGRNRWDATSRMVEWLAKALPGTHVRCGLGTSRLKRFVDARLGWLGSESSLQRAMAGQWRAQLGDSAGSTFYEGNATIRLNCPGRNQIALLSLDGDSVTDSVFQSLHAHETAIAAILWGRPRHALPEWSGTKGRPRVAIIAAGVMLLLLVVCPVPYPASCTVLVEPVGSRVVSAPFEAMLESVAIEPGDEVTKGQLIAVLDGRPLRLEQQSIDAEIQQATKQQDVAIAAGRIAEAQLAQLKCQQLRRQRDLLERRLNQLNITSPIEGVVVAGDLRRSIGIPLESGQVLFEIAPLDRVLLEVEIPEREIGLVNEDSAVQLRVESARTGNVDATLTKIYPMAQLREEKSVFVAPIEVDNSSRQYRPGMRGRATVFGPVRPWAWRHIRGAVEQIAWLVRW